ncbi:MAG: hypothetical protein OIN89_10250 [Candidatus Methanoperedens sp.]|jgi:hypothetical protein|nr:hypothetical protein [Candidatus Methanoperedens sp.]PKL52675.1 MAG: hypothetical protein CVV36_11230 [Candidatus Methanoperedenaceae archaeon HGW-Methanoperedenaceae-1]
MDPFHEKEDVKKEDGRSRISSSALAAFGTLATITIVVITQNYWDDATIKILLFSMFIVLILGFYGHGMHSFFKNYLKKRNDNKLAKLHFKSFRSLVIRFKEFTENSGNIQSVLHYIKNNTPEPNPYNQINVIWPTFIQDRYNFYNERLNQFNETKDSLVSLANEFESILDMYDTLYIKDPVNSIRKIGRDEVSLQFKESYNNARQKYIAFLMDYNKFAKIANEDLVEKKDSFGIGPTLLFRDFFDSPEEL